jgi:AraC-like DNA-binding protein
VRDNPDRSTVSFDSPVRHAEYVLSVAQGASAEAAAHETSNSWLRSANLHGVDPADTAAPRMLTTNELRDRRGPLEMLISSANVEFDRLHALVRSSGYALLFCDMTGSVVAHRGDGTEADQFAYWGTWLGGVWSEATEGTNGIGTCIAEERPVTIHRGEHFRSRHMNLSCSGAPVFGIDGEMIAVLDLSAINPTLSERAHGLTGTLATSAAHAVEERYFREHFHRAWIITASFPPEEHASPILLAVDADQRIVGANRAARRSFALEERRLRAGIGIWELFERNVALFRPGHDNDTAIQLVLAGSDEAVPAIVTSPLKASGDRQNPAYVSQYIRPRVELLRSLGSIAPPPRARGGLPPGVIRRVQEYIDVHMSENVDLPVLAGVAGVSTYHFAREFKRSTGTTPHYFVINRRVERARDMLARTNYSLAEIALAVGFADQSHLSRHFRHIVGSTPREFRWLQR